MNSGSPSPLTCEPAPLTWRKHGVVCTFCFNCCLLFIALLFAMHDSDTVDIETQIYCIYLMWSGTTLSFFTGSNYLFSLSCMQRKLLLLFYWQSIWLAKCTILVSYRLSVSEIIMYHTDNTSFLWKCLVHPAMPIHQWCFYNIISKWYWKTTIRRWIHHAVCY